MTATDRKPNHLADEKSPYLLQHAYNPVDWYPWGDAAFEKAKREDKPIFLSIGYSTCHWCHVMEHESFENDSVAELLNRWFVPVKVDREERPDVDRVYMTSMNAMGMGGGWPLNVFLTPDLRPFYGGTYFPPDARMGRPGMLQMLPRVHEAWTTQRASLEDMGARVFDALAGLAAPSEDGAVTDALFDTCYAQLASARDPELGGFGRAPKFPSISNLNFMVRYWARDPAAHGDALQIALDQLDAMRAGGIHDQIGGGFHRYSTDREWLVPHFEKMLYDQAQIAWAYLDAYRITKRDAYAATARGIFGYVARDLTSPEGAFWSAEDADSEGEEGRFYVWTPAGLDAALGGDDARLFAYRFGVTDAGNFEHGTSILHEAHTLEETAARFSLDPAEVSRRLDRAATKLLEVRAKRPRPHRDDKVLASWNGLMISALARGARTLEDPELARRAERAAAFIWDRLRDPATGALARRWRDGETAGPGQLDDYAYTALGFTDLYAATFDPLWLERAAAVTEAMVDRFWDGKDGAFFDSPAADPHLQIRMKESFDGAEMAGNSIAAYNLLSLASLLDRDAWRDKAQRTLAHYAGRIAEQPAAMPQMLVAMDLARSVPRHVVIAGDPSSSGTRAMLRAFDTRFLPHDALLLVDGGARQRRLEALVPFTGALERKDGRATAYVCVNYACRLPTEDPAVFATQLDEGGTAAPGER